MAMNHESCPSVDTLCLRNGVSYISILLLSLDRARVYTREVLLKDFISPTRSPGFPFSSARECHSTSLHDTAHAFHYVHVHVEQSEPTRLYNNTRCCSTRVG